MKKLIFIKVFLFVIIVANGQENISNGRNLTFKLPISSFFGDVYAESMGIGLGIEKMMKPRLSISQEATYLFHVNRKNSVMQEDLEKLNGIKLTTEIRKYLKRNEIPESGWYVSAEFKNIVTNSVEEVWTLEDELIHNEIFRYRGVLTANLGILVYGNKYKNGTMTLEVLGGGGIGYVKPDSSEDINNLSSQTYYNSANEFYPCLNFDIKIGYILK